MTELIRTLPLVAAQGGVLSRWLTAWRDAGNRGGDRSTALPPLVRDIVAPTAATQGVGDVAASRLFSLRTIGKLFDGGVQALDDINLDIREGEIFGIIGRSGAGKSTLLRTLNLLERPSAGTIEFEGRDLLTLDAAELRQLRRRIGMIFQHFNLLSSRTVAGNIALPLELAGVPESHIATRVDELLDLVGLREQRDRYPNQISGGQKQRVGIARALATEPRVLLCDEATSALDPETTQSILALLADINRRLGLTIVLITHQMQVIKAIAHRVAVLDGGHLAEQGSVGDIFTAPTQEITRTLLREVIGNDIPAGVRDRAARLLESGEGRIWRLSFRGESVDRPALTEAAERFGLKINLLHGYIDDIQGMPFGSLVVAAAGADAVLDAAAAFIESQDIRVEEVVL
ncbi:methionine ABC transporter ATP-binding protein [Propionivibrio dicarboxylicus]|uniref:Cell division ATP-binding protein FtsE n=1 Tax=Propionivibrio dicarboxylicus TaxID=83767 RepID=A0A1G7XUA1_9RHOO|nr:methionine ABC transporter ATP-binding protein [Propionivibrio dicarboxylicus]SDG87778.1 D-methionine transport system ATP-binding protein [Propionivibrio dicarboxylicus]